MGSWTPGPWEVGEVISNQPNTRIDTADGEPVAWAYDDNGPLIAAAPETYEQLDVMCRTYHGDEVKCPCKPILAKVKGN